MTWTKVDDRLHSHPKIQQAWHADPAALGLHLLALSHAGDYLTDGRVSEAFVRSLLPSAARRRRAIAALTAPGPDGGSGLWEPCETGWRIHDYLVDNPSREKVLQGRSERSEQAAAAGRKGATKRWKNRCTSNGEQIAPGRNGETMAPAPYPFPSPT